jgi:hypothetical protein
MNELKPTIRQKRRSEWVRLKKAAATGDQMVVTIRSRDGADVGYSNRLTTPYTGEAGFSNRLRVIWQDGSMTLCCLRGMIPAYEMPGHLTGFREWTIR